ncbi:MAG TPA: anti-sigma factor antagonist [Prolixibacteraceae bacterium]|nr:anti-sigma factor antagonist [Prolixibacteraceae bacterium]
MFDISHRNLQSIPCIAPEGRLDTVNSTSFDQAVQPLTQKESFLIIDFSKCNYLSSTGIRVLLSAAKKLKSKGGMLFVAAVSPEVYQVFEMTGLHTIFRFSKTPEAAAEEIVQMKNKEKSQCEWNFGDQRIQFHPSGKEQEPALRWKDAGIAGYNELGFSVGIGMAADPQEETINTQGLFITTGNAAGFLPNDETLLPDFRIPHNPSHAGIVVKQAVSFGTKPAGWFRLFKPSDIPFGELAENIWQNRDHFLPGNKGAIALVTANFNHNNHGILLSLLLDRSLNEQLNSREFQDVAKAIPLSEEGISLLGARFDCEELDQVNENNPIDGTLKNILTLENIVNVLPIDPEERLSYPLVWVFAAPTFDDAEAHRIQLEVPSEFFAEPYKAFLTRRLYSDSKQVVIKPLHGGFSAQTFQVNSFDKEGRRLRPTVLKIANRAMITREAERCLKYSQPYILNNSAMVLGTEFFGDRGALCYNFVGIGGEETQLKWLTNYFDEWPAGKLEPIFDKTFLQILKPWYGQPVQEAIHPFLDHDPTLTFFPTLCETSENILSVSSDDPFFIVKETDHKLVNPYWFLKHEYPKRRDEAIYYYTAICHGDLNMQNILIDQTMNVYLIDFSETKPRSVVSDFARLEAIFMVERAPLDDEEDMKKMIEFATRFYGTHTLDVLPKNSYEGKGIEKITKNVALTLKMRQYALQSCKGNPSLVPYYFALLEWVLPIVCYNSAPAVKRFSMIVAGLLCEKIIELMQQ